MGRWETFSKGQRNEAFQEEGVGSVTINISVFPDYSSTRDLFDIFGYVGDAYEVKIAPRRNKVGKMF